MAHVYNKAVSTRIAATFYNATGTSEDDESNNFIKLL